MTCLGATSPLLNIYSLPGAVFVMTMAYFPIITLMTMSGLKGIDKCQEEAGWIHGNVIQTILRISLPLATPYIFCGALFVFVFAIINFGVPDILRLRVYPLEIFIQFGALFQEGIAMALSLPLVLLTFLIVYFQKRYMDKRSYVNFGGGYNPAAPYQLGVRQWIFTWFAILVVIVSGAIPIVVLLKMAGPLSTYVRVLQSSIDQLIYSTLMGLAGAACMTILSFLMAFYCFKQKGRIKSLTELSLLFPIAIPSTVFGIGLIYVWNTPMTEKIYTSSAIVIIGYVARFLPFTAMVCLSSLRQMDTTLEELGTLYSGSHMKLFIHILIPLNRIGILTGFFVGFILSLGDLGTSILVMPPGRSTIPVKIYNLMHYGAENMVAALCLILLSIVGISSLVFLNIFRRFRT